MIQRNGKMAPRLKGVWRKLVTEDGIPFSKIEAREQEIQSRMPPHLRLLTLGLGIGVTAAVAQGAMADPTRHVVVDPNPTGGVWSGAYADNVLRKRKFKLAAGVLARPDAEEEQPVRDTNLASSRDVRHWSLAELEELAGGGPFQALHVDCEGAFPHVLRDFPEILRAVEWAVIEHDHSREDAAFCRERLRAAGLERAEVYPCPGGLRPPCADEFHEMWVKKKTEENDQ